MELSDFFPVVWACCFVLVTIDSGWKKINPVFWCLAGLVSGPFAMLAYGLVREKRGK